MPAVSVNIDFATAGAQRAAHPDSALQSVGGAPGGPLAGLFGLFAGAQPGAAAELAQGRPATPFSSLLADAARDLQIDEIPVDSADEGVALAGLSGHWQQSAAAAGDGGDGLVRAALMPLPAGAPATPGSAPEAGAEPPAPHLAMPAGIPLAMGESAAPAAAAASGPADGAVVRARQAAAGGKPLPAGLAAEGPRLPPVGESRIAVPLAAQPDGQLPGKHRGEWSLPPLILQLRAGATPPAPIPGASAPAVPVSVAPVPVAPVSAAPVSVAPDSAAPIPAALVSAAPVPAVPVSAAPDSAAPIPAMPVSAAPVPAAPVSVAPVPAAPAPVAPASAAPASVAPVSAAADSTASIPAAPAPAVLGAAVGGAAPAAQREAALPSLHALLRTRVQMADRAAAPQSPAAAPTAEALTAGAAGDGLLGPDGLPLAPRDGGPVSGPMSGQLAVPLAPPATSPATVAAAAAARAEARGGSDERAEGSFDGLLDDLGAEVADGLGELPRQPTAAAARAGVAQFSLGRAAGSPGWADALGSRLQMLVGQNLNRAQIRLDPPELGAVEVQINLGERGAQLFFGSDNAAAREALDAALPRLRELMGEAGFGELQAQVGDGEAGQRWAREQGGEAGDERLATLRGTGDAALADEGGDVLRVALPPAGDAGFDAYA